MSNIGTLLMVVSTDLPSVTVIIPTFRSADVIERALNSVLAQTHQPAEIIFVDDASGDQTPELLHQLAATDSRIRVLENELNIGPGRSRNRGWDAAKTELVAFLDADDSWDPDKLRIQCQWMRSHPTEVICGTRHRFAHDGIASLNSDSVSRFAVTDILRRNRFTTPSVVIRRAVPDRFDSRLRLAEDYLLWMELAARYGGVNRIDTALTILHKPIYGAGGLSGKTFAMFISELRAILQLRRRGYIGPLQTIASWCWSTLKLARRLPTSLIRTVRWRALHG
jgi:glycosyltransferase involved in cell wall biosynthesis